LSDRCYLRSRSVPAPVNTKRGAEEFERLRRAEIMNPPPEPQKEVPTLEAFSKDFLDTYAETNNKPSEVRMKRCIYKVHLNPTLGKKKLNAIGPREIEGYKTAKLKAGRSAKSVNNDLTILRKTLSVARDWGLIEHIPPFKWMRVQSRSSTSVRTSSVGRSTVRASARVFGGLSAHNATTERMEPAGIEGEGAVVRLAEARGSSRKPKRGSPAGPSGSSRKFAEARCHMSKAILKAARVAIGFGATEIARKLLEIARVSASLGARR
jgi:hypothetical protein